MYRKFFAGAAVIGLLAAPATATDWTYEGETGADRWGHLHTDFEMCERGIMQSPIDLGAGNVNATGEVEVMVHWNAGPLTILNNGHTVQANFAEGSHLMSGGKTFNLVQVHFHTPSEHAVDGERFPLTAHFVHASDAGELAVLGVMYVEGDAHSEMQKLVDAAPAEAADAATVDGVTFDPAMLLPANDGEIEVYRYMGSLTTPPCSEGVNWHVVPEPVEVSAEQIAAMEGVMGMNARPLQLLNGRLLVAPE
ncbi:carbonic anhydrase family protein [Aurantiacibacter sp. MUD11]|uniref:carbonic anhydrase n=1 Tax=Aurantiacibacter sp. MUD11 TaxID=3003265 RepID=UPI0022AB08D2|nr:carbonic anhydrase family protein [Aurantiacibacter sp. MUD11]WAT18696.1 carbonic anhydrase family protein [Aurantiacibacter sp. MUD11]